MKVSTKNDNNFGYEKIMILVDNMPLKLIFTHTPSYLLDILTHILIDLIYTDSDKHCLDSLL